MLPFVVVTLSNAGMLFAAAFFGGAWAWAALAYISLFTAFMDRVIPSLFPDMKEGTEFPSGALFSTLLGLLHFPLMGAALYGLSVSGMGWPQVMATLIAYSLFFGQVSHPNAHELIHRRERYARRLGRIVYATMLYGQHASAHVLIHHVHVATEDDPCTARKGEGFYRYFLRVWGRSLFDGLRAENAMRARKREKPALITHPFLHDVAVGLVMLALAVWMGGFLGFVALMAIALYSQLQIAIADYIQHYGLRRKRLENGRLEPVGPQHSWNTPHWFSSALMLNAARHSDHHVNPQRPYPALELDEAVMPTLPHSLPVMATIALLPPLYRKVMKRELARLPEVALAA
ncbi:alkane 1-monooxygenase [Lentibacter algarum]|uniref:alkane 1-monooxygenase n=1 Tax=Lentibacter algarum TaxID=576131 RepID=UPI001C0986D7|nr:alkane 1-monooxygenase [Lentibacter algarum]MBU2983482.1 alkane 1-monooxygenase [Lentibacter algarum]